MSPNLNEKLYARFGTKVELETIQHGFMKFLKNALLDNLDFLVNPDQYDDYKEEPRLYKIREEILQTACRQMFLDFEDYDDFDYGLSRFLRNEFHKKLQNFNELLIRLQILINILYKYPIIGFELNKLLTDIDSYINDYPVLGIKIKIYKTKVPQIYPSISRLFDETVDNVLGILDEAQYRHTLNSFESGLKGFMSSKDKSQLKNVVEDMSSSCDEMAKVIFKVQSKGFKHVFEKEEYKKFGLSNKITKEIFRNLRDWMDNIKHGSIKDFVRDDVETIIILTAQFLRYSANTKHLRG